MARIATKLLTANWPAHQYLMGLRAKREKRSSMRHLYLYGEGKHTAALLAANEVFKRFNSETKALAMLVVGTLCFVVLIFAVLVRESYPTANNLTRDARPGGEYLFFSDNFRPGEASRYQQTILLNSGPNGHENIAQRRPRR